MDIGVSCCVVNTLDDPKCLQLHPVPSQQANPGSALGLGLGLRLGLELELELGLGLFHHEKVIQSSIYPPPSWILIIPLYGQASVFPSHQQRRSAYQTINRNTRPSSRMEQQPPSPPLLLVLLIPWWEGVVSHLWEEVIVSSRRSLPPMQRSRWWVKMGYIAF